MGKVKIRKYISEFSAKNKFNKPYLAYSFINRNALYAEHLKNDVSFSKNKGYKFSCSKMKHSFTSDSCAVRMAL